MVQKIEKPTLIEAPGEPPKRIAEYIGRVNSDDAGVSVAHMKSPPGWSEPGQRPEFRELTLVLAGSLQVETEGETLEIEAGQAVGTEPGEWIRYSSPAEPGAEYVAICLPAFSPDTVHRDGE